MGKYTGRNVSLTYEIEPWYNNNDPFGYVDNAAWQLHLEQERGSVEVGKYADFVILDENVLTIAPQALSEVKVLNTFFEGKEVFRRQ